MTAAVRIDGVVTGSVVGILPGGEPLVDFPGNPAAPVAARTTVPIDARAMSREIVLVFEAGDPSKPVILGILRDSKRPAPENVEITADGRRLTLAADREIVLRCGKASLTLTREGKVILQGTYVSSRSSGVNRIKGGTVEIN